ncbi:MAG: hypothetical protein AVDCRST_MAG56-3208 [uncultured Cytophagales bacterium]|uniref:Uncharacterized protein n=1 Tax=uncultured Cytophagales bacterium TaxID=158755 RepID=A0A6J4JA08_9SPHI|nr:MAG: hypothetical protein AVDCRST_MAG56-3208 [uncultured Cytophagales bacterium]
MMNIDVVDRISRPAFYAEHVKKGKPVRIKGMMKERQALNWPDDGKPAGEKQRFE